MLINRLTLHFHRLFPAVLFGCLLHAPAGAQSALQRSIDALAKAPELRHASWGVCVIDIASGKVIAAHQPDLSLTPASTLKVVTTATALAVFGPEFRYSTELEYDGRLTGDGRLEGNLYLKGSGDPTLGSGQIADTEPLDDLMQKFRLAVQQKGIREVSGYVIGDASAFPTDVKVPSWQWNDLGNYYAAGVWGLNVHENLYYLRFQQAGSIGATPRIADIEPPVEGLVFHNEVTSAGRSTGDNAYIFGGPYTFLRYVRGTIPVGRGLFTIKGSMPDPPLFAAQYLLEDLEKVGIRSERGATTLLDFKRKGGRPGTRTALLTHHSPPLRAIVERANKKSVNLYCEALLRKLGQAKKGRGGLSEGLDAIAEEWQARGLSLDGIHLRDGSGLSARNAITTRFLAGLLRKSAKDPRIFDALYASLPDRSNVEGQVRAKSGTLDRVRGFAGYVRNRSGNLLAFAVIVNNFEGSGSAMRRRLLQLTQAMANN